MSSQKAPKFGPKAIKIFNSLVKERISEEFAWQEAWKLASDALGHVNCPIESTGSGSYDVQPMSGTITKPKNGAARKVVAEDPLHIVLSRAVSRLIEREGLSCGKADKKYGFPERYIYRLINEPTPGRAGENIDKVAQAFGMSRRELEDLGTPR